MRDVAHEAVFNGFLLDTGALNGVLDGVRGHRNGGGDVEPATARFGQARTGVGNDNRFTRHDLPPRNSVAKQAFERNLAIHKAEASEKRLTLSGGGFSLRR